MAKNETSRQRIPVERVQTGMRMEKRLLKVLKAMAEYRDISLGDLIEGICLHAFDGKLPFDEVGREIYDRILATAAGKLTCSEKLGHHECVLMYKSFDPAGPLCLPTVLLTHGT